jgi:hypothetical protein
MPECLDTSEADIIVRTSDLTSFHVHKLVLASSSSVFGDMFSLPKTPNSDMVNELPVVDISEDAELVRCLITMLYPIPPEIPTSYDRILALLAAAQEYGMHAIQSYIRAVVAHGPSPPVDAFCLYAIASTSGLTPEMDMAVRLTLDQPMIFELLGDGLRLFEGPALSELVSFREQCRDNLASCFKLFLDVNIPPSNIWFGCPKHKTEQPDSVSNPQQKGGISGSTGNDGPKEATPTLPSWVHNIFTHEIAKLNQAFMHPLIKPSSIRKKYLKGPSKTCFSGSLHLLRKGSYHERGVVLCATQAITGPRPEKGKYAPFAH